VASGAPFGAAAARLELVAQLERLRAARERLSPWRAHVPQLDRRRALRRPSPARPAGYALVAVLTLALGIGGVAAVYGVARPVLFDALPYAHAREVGTFWMGGSWTEEEFVHLRGRIPGFRQVAAYRPGDVTLREGDAPARLVPGITTSAELFEVLGARPLIGRGFRPGDDTQGAEPVVVLSYGLWQELGGRPTVLGSRITLDGAARTVVGVMPRGFWFPDPAVRIWTARALDPEGRNGSYTLVGRVAPGQDVAALGAPGAPGAPGGGPLARLTAMLDERFDYPADWDKTKDAAVTPLRDELLGTMRPALVATFVAMGLILLMACANVAALMLGQVEGRSTELAVRSALGANRRRLTQQLVVEALLVGLTAGVAGAGLAAMSFRVLARALPLGAWGESAAFDWTLFVAALLVAVGAVLLVVLVPTTSLWRGDLRGTLGSTRTGGIQGRGGAHGARARGGGGRAGDAHRLGGGAARAERRQSLCARCGGRDRRARGGRHRRQAATWRAPSACAPSTRCRPRWASCPACARWRRR
jgi:hypothetical protein